MIDWPTAGVLGVLLVSLSSLVAGQMGRRDARHDADVLRAEKANKDYVEQLEKRLTQETRDREAADARIFNLDNRLKECETARSDLILRLEALSGGSG